MKSADLANALLHAYLNAPTEDAEVDRSDKAIVLLDVLSQFAEDTDIGAAVEKMLEEYRASSPVNESGGPDFNALPSYMITIAITTSVRLGPSFSAEAKGSLDVPRTPFNLKSAIASLYEELVDLSGPKDATGALLEVAARGRVG